MAALIGAAPIGLVLIRGARGEHISGNAAAERLIGQPLNPDRGIDQVLDRIRDPDGLPLDPGQLPGRRALRGERVDAEEMLAVRADGSSTPVLASASPVLGETGQPVGAIVAVVDVTLLKRLERLREEWMAIVAHDLRQPLSTIATYAAALAHGCSPGRSGAAIQRQVKRLERMIRDLLDLSRIEASKLQLERELVDVASVVGEIAEHVAATVQDRHLSVHVRGRVPPVEADHERLSQILDNLIGNAIRYGDPGTEIDIDVEPRPPCEVAVAVSNHGPGIDRAALPHLFERFERGASRASKRESLGLGLYITKGLVEAQGGHIEVSSTPGDTTTFRFTLPAHRA